MSGNDSFGVVGRTFDYYSIEYSSYDYYWIEYSFGMVTKRKNPGRGVADRLSLATTRTLYILDKGSQGECRGTGGGRQGSSKTAATQRKKGRSARVGARATSGVRLHIQHQLGASLAQPTHGTGRASSDTLGTLGNVPAAMTCWRAFSCSTSTSLQGPTDNQHDKIARAEKAVGDEVATCRCG